MTGISMVAVLSELHVTKDEVWSDLRRRNAARHCMLYLGRNEVLPAIDAREFLAAAANVHRRRTAVLLAYVTTEFTEPAHGEHEEPAEAPAGPEPVVGRTRRRKTEETVSVT